MARRAAIVFLCLLAIPASASAGGFEATSQGTLALGRGGAYAARASDPTVLQYSPASLADVRDVEILLSAHFVHYDACVRRAGTYGDNVAPSSNDTSRFGPFDAYRSEPFPEVCREGPIGITPILLASIPLADDLGLGFGLLTPVGAGSSRWGDSSAAVRNAAGEHRPSPVRYLLAETSSALVNWSAGVGYRPAPWIAAGLTLHWAMASSESAVFVAFDSSENPAYDIRSELDVSDLFVPGVTAALKLRPLPELEAVIGLRWLDDVRASGSTNLIFGVYESGEALPGHTARVENPIDDFTITTPQQTKLWASMRYAHLRSRSALSGAGDRDPMRDEHFDVELGIGWELNSRVDAFLIDVPDDANLDFAFYDASGTLRMPTGAPIDDRAVPKLWKHQLTLHLGGDVHLVPERLTVRGGASFETRGIDVTNLSVDFMPLMRLGIHAGVTLRLGEVDLSLAYAHIFQESVTISPAEARYNAVAASGTGPIVNAGTYESSYDVVSFGGSYRFR